ncbi:hypothetical protein WR25_22889 [Diploscapter pachys]|uniref:NAA35-like N-terminal domain-containing protein n=1 Tax=Diploscapter pachys TaxID=2018661 RepID=A0A2A2KTJ1_9BILA|nr:hypothetical protein WR25_22889 [Diploscapter pachys]
MSEEQDRDQKDRDEGRPCGFVEEQERPAPPMGAPKQDVTQQFFRDCHKLDVGCVMIYNNFPMLDLMSAVELMDPKMDMGMSRMKKHIGLDVCVEQGLYSSNWKEQLTIIDATLSCLVSYLEGQNIAQTFS